ncbi:MAG: hypothetical protein MSG64_08235 [Pyrinomonadaceae bacterium MAG19_C2-C3]|nr:hypothetical protein [Pyrinomonadaceae bacterium MAG19_C2-C3]
MTIICGVFASVSAFGAISKETAQLFPARFGDFRAQENIARELQPTDFTAQDYAVVEGATRRYVAPDTGVYVVEIFRTASGSAAFSLLTAKSSVSNQTPLELNDVGGYGFASANEAMFVKDKLFVRIKPESDVTSDTGQLTNLARLIAASIDGEAGGVPVLARHIPDWEQIQNRIKYAVSAPALRNVVNQDTVLDALNFAGGTETAIVDYNASAATDNQAARLIIVEHLTPQLATDNFNRVSQLIKQRREQGANVPSDFRRTGNYLVFVYGVSDAETGAALAKRVRYEQDVRWLGDYPFAQERAERQYTMMTLSVLIGSIKTTGIAVTFCLLVGIIVGGTVFMRRRSQSAAANMFTDAGGMVRLNIDELTKMPASKLIGSGDEPRG